MDPKKIAKIIIVYLLLIPITWLLSVMVTGGVGGYIAGQRIAKAYSDPQTSNELSAFMKKHGFADSMTKKESKLHYEKLSPQEKAEFKKIISSSVKVEDMFNFGSIFVICVIVFSFIGILSGILTKTWIPAVVFPLVVLSLDPLRQFIVYGYMTTSQKVITVLVGQFIICYAFAFLGVAIANRFSRIRGTNLPVHSDAP
ncbi:MAG TPA: hypothetical protein VN604_01815 [Nitrospirota bacterium]|nr:hypothetical protein [Nitrospirota bacterium]